MSRNDTVLHVSSAPRAAYCVSGKVSAINTEMEYREEKSKAMMYPEALVATTPKDKSAIMRSLGGSTNRNKLHLSLIDTAVLLIYSAIVAVAIAHHEPWADEAQAWQLSRNLSLHDLFFKYLHYEGHPGLWYVFLRVLYLAGVSYNGMHWVCGAIGVFATWLLLAHSPFPQPLRALLPFTFFLIFHYVVVARSYVLVPLILYIVAWQWKKSPLLVGFLLGLLANVQMHAAAISAGLAITYGIEQWREGVSKDASRLRTFFGGAFVLVVLFGVAISTAWLAPDWSFGATNAAFGGANASFFKWLGSVLYIFLCYGICASWPLALGLVIAVGLWWLKRKKIIYFLPFVALVIISTVGKEVALWHAGLINPLLIATLWMTWPLLEETESNFQFAARVAWTAIAGIQILYAANTIWFDFYHNYSGDLAAAKFLKPYVARGDSIAVTCIQKPGYTAFHAVGILPYFEKSIYVNWQEPFWWWSSQDKSEELFEEFARRRPDIIILEASPPVHDERLDLKDPKLQSLVKSGYRVTNRFCGSIPVYLGLSETNCHIILFPSGASQQSSNQ